jgi:hypothetical protein
MLYRAIASNKEMYLDLAGAIEHPMYDEILERWLHRMAWTWLFSLAVQKKASGHVQY